MSTVANQMGWSFATSPSVRRPTSAWPPEDQPEPCRARSRGLSNVVLRHDLAEKPPAMSEANPHLLFHGFSAKMGLRVKTILQATRDSI